MSTFDCELSLDDDLEVKAVIGVATDEKCFFRGKLDSIQLVKVKYSDDRAVDIYKENVKDEGDKIQLQFNFLLFSSTEGETIKKYLRTGTNFNKRLITQKYKSRGNKVMKSIFNQFTELCVRLNFVNPTEWSRREDELTKQLTEKIKGYNKRTEEEKILIAGRYIDGNDKSIMDLFDLIFVHSIDYNEDIDKRLQSHKEARNKSFSAMMGETVTKDSETAEMLKPETAKDKATAKADNAKVGQA